jgi:hypothetical protein
MKARAKNGQTKQTPLAHDNVHCLPYELEAPHVGLVLVCRQVFTNPVHLGVKPPIRQLRICIADIDFTDKLTS